MQEELTTMDALSVWRDVLVKAGKEMDFDLSTRQTTILMTVYLDQGPHSIKSLSEQLGISKASVCRAVDLLCIKQLCKRKKDENDRRNVFIQRTIQGSVFLSDFADVVIARTASLLDRKHEHKVAA